MLSFFTFCFVFQNPMLRDLRISKRIFHRKESNIFPNTHRHIRIHIYTYLSESQLRSMLQWVYYHILVMTLNNWIFCRLYFQQKRNSHVHGLRKAIDFLMFGTLSFFIYHVARHCLIRYSARIIHFERTQVFLINISQPLDTDLNQSKIQDFMPTSVFPGNWNLSMD